ncbi:SRPBCC family protein [Lysinibacillus capsici]|uniref:SRPBCC family protein n=1 Tax=Lysinibacillus capsici TaxID=2115968 RepID=A0ABY8KB91_9BACI|nr:SRPBCC family protein [Lysinibacillus capsici]MCT1540043.1 SRPBCC family protein [Lysinibacillus capsici]MCT1571067.1 SRPBCC family protein [Lysinibacillus capsici]MCT1648516.1 SRPBCC family protein [Lysinibacillus capsici]MCT1727058.1 SRPBCC family protein [Lysinibacillus capsici]MCT1784411.1 SRPBCC family protein [Lysinibacillus capsici]
MSVLATIEKQSNYHIATFKRPLLYSIDAVWAAMTNNENLQKWMSNLEIIELRKNGKIHFNMNDGTGNFEEITITDYVEKEVLGFGWGTDTVRFELFSTEKGSLLVLVETLQNLTEHTPKDLAGWHICLDMLKDLLNGVDHQYFPMDEWQQRFSEYQKMLNSIK